MNINILIQVVKLALLIKMIEMQSGTQISESVEPNAAIISSVAITPNVVSNTPDVIPHDVTNPICVIQRKKRGRKKETLPKV